jgi:diguanylate cyclase (GGDEF)-like protein
MALSSGWAPISEHRMRLEGTFVRSRIARRILLLFVLCALLPALALALLTLGQVRAILTEQAHAQLVATSKSYALTVYERLLLAHRDMQQMAADLRDGEALGGAAPKMMPDTYSSLSIVGPGIRPVPLLGEPLSWSPIGGFAIEHLKTGESVLVVERVAGGAPRVVLLQMIDPSRPERFALAAELNPAELWVAPAGVSRSIGVCVVADTGAMLSCSKSDDTRDPGDATRTGSNTDGTFSASADTGPMIVGQWQLFLKPKFFAPYWTVIATEPSSAATAPIEQFTRIFLQVIGASLLLVALLSVAQIRRTMGPLEKLIDGVRRLGGADFTHRVEVGPGDEFGQLATAFNEMASRLGRQLDTLKALSSIDQVILSKRDIDPVFGLALTEIRSLAPAGSAGIVVLEPAVAGEARAYTLAADGDGRTMSRVRLPQPLLARIAAQMEGSWLDRQEELSLTASRLPAGASRWHFFVVPIMDRGSLCAFAWLSVPDAKALADEALAPMRELCDRVGVALSAAARDEQLIYQIRHDDLTGLPNRLLLKERLSQEIASARRDGHSLALLYVDLDRFKSVNDSLGHTAGDDLLGQTAERMRGCIRESDTLARLGGDEFAIVLPNIAGPSGVSTVAEHLVEALSESFVVGQHETYVSASIGIAICPTDGDDSEELLKKADTAMYRAKDGGRGRFVFFEERMNAEAVERLALERELRQALLRDEFSLHFQPQFDLRSGWIVGVEALLRWNHPTRGLVMPGAFIGVAEETGLIEEIGRKVLSGACAQHAVWRAAGLRPPRIAVNVSSRQFRRGDLVQDVEGALRESGTPGSALEIEVTESLFMDESAHAVAALEKLRRMGVQVAIDDFGTGYSSMSYLKRLPVDVLKVDQSFISDIIDNFDTRAIAKAIIKLGQTLNKSVVAEGVETPAQLELLKRWRCDRVQGYLLARPLAPDQFAEFLQQRSQTAVMPL